MCDFILSLTELFLLCAKRLIVRLAHVLQIGLHLLPVLRTILGLVGLHLRTLQRLLHFGDFRLQSCEFLALPFDQSFVLFALGEELRAVLVHLM